MEPPKSTLPTTVEHLQPSVLIVAFRVLAVLFMFDTVFILLLVGFFGLNNAHEWHNSYIVFLLLVDMVKYIAISVMVIKLFSEWAGRAYYLSGHHLIERLGLVNITETTYELSQVKSVIVFQSWLGRRFNFGTITLSFAGTGKKQELTLRDINTPVKYKEYFDQHLQVQGWIR